MLKRLIEVALPLKEVSEQSAREKSIRHGHISTLHIWWARRPLAACRAVVFASLIPDPDDPDCPGDFRELVMEVLQRREFKPTGLEPSPSAPVPVGRVPLDDTPRNRCIEFIKHLVRWENSNNPEYIEPARKLIGAAHSILRFDAESDAPKVLDPFGGGGAIPLEALRLGCEAHAIDLNPVAHLIELCTLVYPQKYGQPDSLPVPEYINRLAAKNRAKRRGEGVNDLFAEDGTEFTADDSAYIPDVEITEKAYRQNPLAADVKYWGEWVLEKVRHQLKAFYPEGSDGSIPVSYLWARTVKCPNPGCRLFIPLIQQQWLCRKVRRKVALRIHVREDRKCEFEVIEDEPFGFDPNTGTMQQGRAKCPACETVVDGDQLRAESCAGRMGEQLIAAVCAAPHASGKLYRSITAEDEQAFENAKSALERLKSLNGQDVVPIEKMTPDRPCAPSLGDGDTCECHS